MNKRFNDYSDYIRNHFGSRVQKISVNTGLLCPNRDGTKGKGGCTYCNIASFRPDYAIPQKSVKQQLEEGISFFSKKYKTQKYLAYFQSYTNTYDDYTELKRMYEEALCVPGITGLVIATRPDCISEEVYRLLSELNKETYLSVELGIESVSDATLLKINRCHTFEETVIALNKLHRLGIRVGGHYILGFPWEEKDEILNQAIQLSKLPLDFLKIHHLQILKHTQLGKDYVANPGKFTIYTKEEYLDLLIEFLERLPKGLILQRFISESPPHLLLAPVWNGVKNFQFKESLMKRMEELGTFQSRLVGID